MNEVRPVWRGWLRVMAMGIAMLAVPLGASAHAAADHASPGGERVVDAGGGRPDPALAGCMHASGSPVGGTRLHCHFSSLPSMAVGSGRLYGHDPAGAPPVAQQEFPAPAPAPCLVPLAHVPIVGPPRYILFGNFRS